MENLKDRDEREDIDINKGIELALSAPFPQVAIHHLIDKVIDSIMSKNPIPNLTPESEECKCLGCSSNMACSKEIRIDKEPIKTNNWNLTPESTEMDEWQKHL
jgi:hypothetical protein